MIEKLFVEDESVEEMDSVCLCGCLCHVADPKSDDSSDDRDSEVVQQ